MNVQKRFSFGVFEEDGWADERDADYRFCVFSDVHHGNQNYNCFACTEGLKRLQRILDDSSSCDFFLSLGDLADNLLHGIQPYEEVHDLLKKNNVRFFNGEHTLQRGERFLYNVVGNHEIAFLPKRELAAYTPYVDGVGNVYAFSHQQTLFIAYDGVFSADTCSDTPKDILPTRSFTIPTATLSYLKKLLNELTDGAKSIVAFSHICLKDIQQVAREQWLELLLSYGLPVYVFEGHAHRQNCQIYVSDNGQTAQVFTLPSVKEDNTYNRYEVLMKQGVPIRIHMLEKPL